VEKNPDYRGVAAAAAAVVVWLMAEE